MRHFFLWVFRMEHFYGWKFSNKRRKWTSQNLFVFPPPKNERFFVNNKTIFYVFFMWININQFHVNVHPWIFEIYVLNHSIWKCYLLFFCKKYMENMKIELVFQIYCLVVFHHNYIYLKNSLVNVFQRKNKENQIIWRPNYDLSKNSTPQNTKKRKKV